MEIAKGLLTIKPIRAELHREVKKTHLLDEEFCVVKLGEQSMTTHSSHDCLLKPAFSDIFMFEKTGENMVRIELWNRNPEGQASMIGYAEIPTGFIQENGSYSGWFDLISDIYQVGQLYVETEFLPEKAKREETQEEEAKMMMIDLDSNKEPSDKIPMMIDDGMPSSKGRELIIETKQDKQMQFKEKGRAEEAFLSKGIKEKAAQDRAFIKDSETLMYDPHNPQLLKKKIVDDEDDEESEKFRRVQEMTRDKRNNESQRYNYASWR